MNKHKEALQKIANSRVPLGHNDLFKHCGIIKEIATEALQSESSMYSEEEMCGFAEWAQYECFRHEGDWILDKQLYTTSQLLEIYLQSLQPKTEELKEGLKPCPNHPDVLTSQCGICNGTFPKLEQPSPSIEKK